MKPTISGVPARPSITIPTAIEPITVELQSRKNGSRQREAASRRRGSAEHAARRRSTQPRQTEISRPRCSLCGRLREVGDDRDRGGHPEHAADHHVARAKGDLFGVRQRPQPHLLVVRPLGARM